MSEKFIYRKYRPRKLAGVVGQEHVKLYFKNAVKEDGLAHAYLLSGKRGTGKTTIARIISLIVNCEDGPSLDYDTKSKICQSIIEGKCPDVHELDAASNTSIDDIRNIRKLAGTFPIMCRKRVFIIDEVHCLRGAAVSALLKILEEPPESSMFILATSEGHKILPTIQSRCQRFDLRDIPVDKMLPFLAKVAKAEKAKIIKRDAMTVIAKKAKGSMRDALVGLDAVLKSGDGEVTMDIVKDLIGGDMDRANFCNLLDAIVSSDYKKAIASIKDKTTSGVTPVQFFDDLLEYSHDLMLSKSMGSSDHLVLSDNETDVWESALESYDLKTILRIHSMIINYTSILQTTMRPDILLDTCIIDIINRLEG